MAPVERDPDNEAIAAEDVDLESWEMAPGDLGRDISPISLDRTGLDSRAIEPVQGGADKALIKARESSCRCLRYE
jgi:hypothetical protein